MNASSLLPLLKDVEMPILKTYGSQSFIRTEELYYTIPRDNCTLNILKRLNLSNLKVLKVPFPRRSRSSGLKTVLEETKMLKSLAITSIPVQYATSEKLSLVGQGLIACSSSLQNLHLVMQRGRWEIFNRESPYNFQSMADESFRSIFAPFIEVDKKGEIGAERPAPILKLTSLCLEKFTIPSRFFNTVFDPQFIKHMSLPQSLFDCDLWDHLGRACQLHSLTVIIDFIDQQLLLDFIQTQNSVERLTFERFQVRST